MFVVILPVYSLISLKNIKSIKKERNIKNKKKKNSSSITNWFKLLFGVEIKTEISISIESKKLKQQQLTKK